MRALFLALIFAPGIALAQPKCGPHAGVVQMLETDFGETRQAIGLRADAESFVEIYANSETGTYTVLVTKIDGVSCMVDEGTNFELLSEVGGEPV